MVRLIRVPAGLDNFFHSLAQGFHGHHCSDFRLLVVPIAVMWGRRHVANLERELEAPSPRPRVPNFCVVARGDPEAARRQKAHELLRALHPQRGDTLERRIDAAQQAKRGQPMDAVAKRQDPTPDASIRGHPSVCGRLVCRQQVSPWGLRL
jgi:hypothetical protein